MPRKFEERNNYQGIAVDFIFCIKRVYAHTDECRLKLPGPILSLARLLAYLGEYGLAENLVYEAYKKDSDVKNGFTLMAKEACAQGELLQAKKLIELDMEHERTDSKGDIIKSEILASLKESELAKKKFNRIYIEDNKLLSIYFEVAKDLDLKGIINEQELLEGVESFFVETYRKNNRLMAGEITNYYDANALSVDIFSRIGNIHRERRLDLREGLALMQRDYALERQSPEWTLRMAEMYLRCNDLKSALRLVASVYRDNPSIKDGYGRLGCLLASQNLEAGRRLAARDLNSSRLSNQWKIHFALLEYKLGRKDAAFTLIDRTYGADPSMKDAYIALALLESKAGRHLQALDLAERDFISNRLSEKGKVLYAKFVSKRIGENKALGILKDIYARNSLSNELDLIDASKASFYLGGYGLALKFLENAKEKNIAHPKVLNEECRQRSIIATWNWLKVGFCDHGCELGHVLPPKADSYIGLLESVTSCDLSHLEVDYELFHYISRGVLALSLKTDPNSFEKDVLPLIRKSLTYLKLSERSKSDDEVHFFDELLTSLYYQKPIFSIIEQVNLSKHLRFSTFGYLLLADVLAWTGLFNLYHDSRLDAEINAINLKNKNFVDGMPRAFRALISQCRFEEALDLSRDAARVFNVKTSLCWQGYINLASGDTDGFVHLQKRFVENYSSQYYRYMMGKSVAIVGPSGSDEELREEIDQYDIVIRLNWRPVPYSEKLSYKKAVDRVDISYYTKHVFYSLSIEERQSISNKLKFYCLDVIQNSDAQAVSDFSQGKARRPHGNSYLLHKFPSAIQRVVFDVLSYNPKKVKVFKCNFYSSVDLYEKSYEDQIIEMPGIRKSKSIPRESTWAHDLWSNYNFISTLHNYGVIDVDSGCSEILGLGVKSYLSLMQDRHGTNF